MSSHASNDSADSPNREQRLDELLAELIRAEETGTPMARDEVLAEHPDFASELNEFFDQRQRMNQLVQPLRDAAALNIRCPHCHYPIELLDDAPVSDISCPSCGSSFSLVGSMDETLDRSIGSTIGHFELLDRVGIGQFGSVWKARDSKLDRTVAVKIPRRGQLDSSQTEMFLRDARATAQLKHSNIVGVHEVGKQDDTIYIVSDFIQGASLKEWITTKRLTPREAAELCAKIAKALHHAHESGVIHRDLKPGNIMMDVDGEPHIVDFGLAKREAAEITMTVEGQILGTPAYMPPEQARGEGHKVDRRADIYSLGVILFELLTGELPFRGDKQMLIIQILKDDPPSLRKLNSSVPRDLETICLRCLEKEPDKRIRSAAELANELCRFLTGNLLSIRSAGFLERAKKWTKRNPAATVAGSVILLATLVTILVLLVAVVLIAGSRNEAITARDEAIDLADENRELARKNGEIAKQERQLRMQTKRHAVRLLFEQSLFRCETGDPATGLLWLAHSLDKAVEIGDSDLEASIRLQLGTWHRNVPHLQWIVPGTFRYGVAFSPDSKIVLLPFADGTAGFREVATGAVFGRPLRTDIGTTFGTTCALFSPDGKTLFLGGYSKRVQGEYRHKLHAWDVMTGEPIDVPAEIGVAASMAFLPDGRTLLTVSNSGVVRTLDVETKVVSAPVRLFRKDLYLRVAAISPDGKTIVEPGEAPALWNVATGKKIRTLSLREFHHGDVSAFSADGKRLIIGGDGLAHIFNVSTGVQTAPTVVHGYQGTSIRSVVFSPDGEYVVTGGSDRTARVWHANTGEPFGAPLWHEGQVYAASFSPDGMWIITVGPSARLWRFYAGAKPEKPSVPIEWLESGRPRTSKSGLYKLVASGDGNRTITNVETGTNVPLSIPQRPIHARRGGPFVAAFSSDDGLLITGSETTARIWDTATGKPLGPPLSHSGLVADVQFSPDGELAITATDEGIAQFWETRTGRAVGRPLEHGEAIDSVSVSADGRTSKTESFLNSRWWHVPQPIQGKPKQIMLWVQVMTCMEIGEHGESKPLDAKVWEELRQRLHDLGGPPVDSKREWREEPE